MYTKSFLEFVAGIFEVEVDELSINTQFGSIPQWDSLMHIRLVVGIEEKYNVEIPLDVASEIKELSEFYNYIMEANIF